jgi:hypothetical protein
MASTIRVRLPTGGTLVAALDPFQDVPSDCSRIISFLPQIASYLAGLQCLQKVLQLTRPLVEVVKSLPPSTQLAVTLPNFLKAAEEITLCLNSLTAANIQLFARDFLCLIIKVIQCITKQMESVVSAQSGLARQLHVAEASGNSELQKSLRIAQENATVKIENLVASLDSVREVVNLSEIVLGEAGISTLQVPTGEPAIDPQAMTKLVARLQVFASGVQKNIEALGGCD